MFTFERLESDNFDMFFFLFLHHLVKLLHQLSKEQPTV